MLTFFTTAKPFTGHSGIIQRNALKSWKLLHPDIEVILFGSDEGAAEVCAEMGLRHEPHVERHESGMKYLDYMFRQAQKAARHPFLCYSNCDIVQLPEFLAAFLKVRARMDKFLLVARRWDTNIEAPVNFESTDWPKRLRRKAIETGFQQVQDFVDFFVFPKNFYTEVPPLVVGRSYWDHWLVWRALSGGLAVVDASRYAVAVHQNHNYGYHAQGKQGTNEDPLAMRNLEVAGGKTHQRSIHDATHALSKNGHLIRTPVRRFFATLYAMRRKQGFLEHTFQLRNKLGLRREFARRFLASGRDEDRQ
jgi:hypothetical protein